MLIEVPDVKLHFAHANGFPAASYQKLFNGLPENFSVLALDKFGHTARFPISNNWGNQVAELIHYVEAVSTTPVYAVGHSFGAVISYMAACTRPELFKGLIMLDPPIITGFSRLLVKVLKPTPFIDRLTPAAKTVRRCKRWAKSIDIAAYFKARGLFENMDDDCIEDYVKAVTELNCGHYTLSFDPDIEANIFRKLPHNINRYYGQLKTPALLITGEDTMVCVPRLIGPFVRANKLEHKVFSGGGHMFPLEQPIDVANLIASAIGQWESK